MSFENFRWYSQSWAVEIVRQWIIHSQDVIQYSCKQTLRNIYYWDVIQYSCKQIYSKKKQWYWTSKATREAESFSWQQYLHETWNQLSPNQLYNYTKARIWRGLVLTSSPSPSGYSGSSCRWTESCRSRPLGKMWYTIHVLVMWIQKKLFVYALGFKKYFSQCFVSALGLKEYLYQWFV